MYRIFPSLPLVRSPLSLRPPLPLLNAISFYRFIDILRYSFLFDFLTFLDPSTYNSGFILQQPAEKSVKVIPVCFGNTVVDRLSFPFCFYHPHILQLAQVLGDGRDLHPQDIGEVADAKPLFLEEEKEDLQADGVAREGEYAGQLLQLFPLVDQAGPVVVDQYGIGLDLVAGKISLRFSVNNSMNFKKIV